MIAEVVDTRQVKTHPPLIIDGQLVNIYALAQKLNVDETYLSRVLRGKRLPTVAYAKMVATALGMNYITLLSVIEDKLPKSA